MLLQVEALFSHAHGSTQHETQQNSSLQLQKVPLRGPHLNGWVSRHAGRPQTVEIYSSCRPYGQLAQQVMQQGSILQPDQHMREKSRHDAVPTWDKQLEAMTWLLHVQHRKQVGTLGICFGPEALPWPGV